MPYGYTYKPNEGGNFIKLSDGDKIKVRLVSDVFHYQKMFENSDKMSTRFAWKALTRGDKPEVKILEQGVMVYKQIFELAENENWGDPTKYDITISRTGSGQTNTRYRVDGVPKSIGVELTADEKKLVEESNINLEDLEKNSYESYKQMADEPLPEEQEEAAPF